MTSPSIKVASASSHEPIVTLSIASHPNGQDFLITLSPPIEPTNPGTRAPVDIVLVIDVSGSMSSMAPAPAVGENTLETTGDLKPTVLDLAKHAVRTIVEAMKPNDRVSIVTFCYLAKEIFPLTFMDERAKKNALRIVDALKSGSYTNIWGGLQTGMDVLRIKRPDETLKTQRFSSIFLLTDGEPNVMPLEGHIAAVTNYLASYPLSRTRFTINTFGFGGSPDSQLLSKVAALGKGNYVYIADPGMVGTVFIHATANALASFSDFCEVVVKIRGDPLVGKPEVLGALRTIRTSEGVKFDLGGILFGQTRDVVVRVAEGLKGGKLTATARYRPWSSPRIGPDTFIICAINAALFSPTPNHRLLYHIHRSSFVQEVLALFPGTGGEGNSPSSPPPNAVQKFRTLAEDIRRDFDGSQEDRPSQSDAIALAEDIDGEVTKALSSKREFRRWGRHYLPSLARSHQLQQCSNFKDKSLRVYGRNSPLFIKEKNDLNKLFDTLPPPASVVHENARPHGKVHPPATPQRVPQDQMLGNTSAGVSIAKAARSRVNVAWPPWSTPSSFPPSWPQPPTASTSVPTPSLAVTISPATTRDLAHNIPELATSTPPSIFAPTPRVAVLSLAVPHPPSTQVQYVIASIPTPPPYPFYIVVPSTDPPPSSRPVLEPPVRAPPSTFSQSTTFQLRPAPPVPTWRSGNTTPMANWNNQAAPCFAGECLVESVPSDPATLATVRVDQLVRGMKLRTPVGPRSVVAVVRTAIPSGELELCAIGEEGLLITPWHPIKSGEWVFPAGICPPRAMPCAAVYSILLEPDQDSDAHSVWIGGVLCVTLGHGIIPSCEKRTDVRVHPFLGDYAKVVQSLARNPAFFEERGVLEAHGIVREEQSGLICGFAWKMDGVVGVPFRVTHGWMELDRIISAP